MLGQARALFQPESAPVLPVAATGAGGHLRRVRGTDLPPTMPTAARASLALLAVLACALTVHLWGEWRGDPDLSHGFAAPVCAVLLVVLGLRPAPRFQLDGRPALALTAVFGAAAVAGTALAALFAATLDWSSALVDFTLCCAFASLWIAAAAAFADRRVGAVAFTWPTLAGALLWPLSSPLPPGTYSRLTLGLQLRISEGVTGTLDMMGIAARRHGNVIELARGSVGIEEACSGVRSLVACVFAGVLFSATLVRRPGARLAVVAAAAPLALAMNFVRSLLLTLLVNAGVRVEGAWHDATGYAVLALTAALLVSLALALDRAPAAPSPPLAPAAPAPAGQARAAGLLSAVLAALVGALAFFVAETPSAGTAAPAPDLAALLPAAADGWREAPAADLYRFTGTLRTDHLAQRTYLRGMPGSGDQVTLYLAYWSPGQASVGLVRSHTPDACWPGAGWTPQPVDTPRTELPLPGARLPAAEHRLFEQGGYPQEVWFWQLYRGRPVVIDDPRSAGALVRLALRYGFRRGGEQAFIRISSNRPWSQLEREPLIAEFLKRVRILGLY